MKLYLEGRKTVVCVRVAASLDRINEVLEETASNYINTSIKLFGDQSDGTATINICSHFTPRLLDDFTVERIARATPFYPQTILSSVMADREAAATGRLDRGFGPGPIFVLDHAEDYTVFEYDLDDLDKKPSFDKTRALGYQSLVLAAVAAGINLRYDPEPMMTMRDGLNAIQKVFGDWEKLPKKEWERKAKERIQAAKENEQKEKERRSKLIEEAKAVIVKGVEKGKYTSVNESIADLEYDDSIVRAAWRRVHEEIVKAYWRRHSEKRARIEADISQAKSELASSKSRESSLREELASLSGLFKGKKRREVAELIERETVKQEEPQKRIESLSAKFDTMPI